MKLSFLGALLIVLTPAWLRAQGMKCDSPYEKLHRQIELYQGTPKVWPFLKRYMDLARAEGNKAEIVAAYKEMLHECPAKHRLAYADSMLVAAKTAKDDDLIGASYLTKGILYYKDNEHQMALDNYVEANRYLVRSRDQYLRHKVKYSIAQIKFYLGYYQEAIALFRECITYYKHEDILPYLKSLHGITVCYILTDDLQQASHMNAIALEESARLGSKDMLPYIESASGIISYKSGDFESAVNNLSYALPLIRKDGDYPNEAITQFFLGKSYWDTGRREKAVTAFKAVDEIFLAKKYLRPDLRQSYEYLIKYYYNKQMRDQELVYVERLLKADSVLGREFRYLVSKIHKEYDTAELIAEKEEIQSQLARSHYSGLLLKGAVGFLVAAIAYLAYRQRRLKRLHRQRFEELLAGRPERLPAEQGKNPKALTINPVIVIHIRNKIAEFEHKRGYLKKDITATKLAESFNTNEKYLREVVKAERSKGFTNYINDLRIDYIVERLKAEPVLRRYSNGTLADEAGFSTTQHFITAFKKRAKITPGYFVKEFDKLEVNPLV